MKLSGNFPPKLVTNNPATLLQESETPEATGISVSSEGYMANGTIPTGAARTTRSYSVSGNTWYWYYDRLWRFSGSTVYYNAPYYTTVIYPQALGNVDLNGNSNSILAMIPIGETGLIFMRNGGSNILAQANDKRAFFFVTDFIQEASITNATYAVELDGLVYFINTKGLFSISDAGKITELSIPVRGSITPAALTCDYEHKYIIIGTSFAYDVQAQKFFQYSGSTFNYYSRKVRSSDNSAVTIDSVSFEFDKSATTSAEIKFVIQTEERGWSKPYTVSVSDREEENERVSANVDPYVGLSWQLRITQLPSNIKLKNIWIRIKGFTPESREA